MTKTSLDDIAETLLKEENPTAEAVNALIKVRDKERNKPSDVELKTDLSDDEVKIHSVLSVLNTALEGNFKKTFILGGLIESKERKALSKDRKSRTEIVEVARRPDVNTFEQNTRGEGFIKKMFTPRKQ